MHCAQSSAGFEANIWRDYTHRLFAMSAIEPTARDDWDNHWTEYAVASADNPAQEYRRRIVMRMLTVSDSPRRLLDIGAGTGELAATVRAAFPDADIFGLEFSAAGVELARRRVPDAEFIQRDLLEPGKPSPDRRKWATHAVCSEVLEHVERPEALLANALPYLAPGCRLVVTVPGGPVSAFDRHIGHRRHYSRGELGELLVRVGLEVEHVAGAGFPFFNLYRLSVVLRGARLANDVAGGVSPFARVAMRAFRILFHANLDSSPWGWQTIALARVPGEAS